MLILSRREGEGITLTLPSGEKIEIVLNEYRGQQTIVGIDAPQDVFILRNELLESLPAKHQKEVNNADTFISAHKKV